MTPADAPLDDRPATDAETAASPIDEVAELRRQLWEARDATIGAIAAAGTLRARNAELEALVHQLRTEVDRLAHVEHSLTNRVGSTVLRPLKFARRLAR